MIYYAILGILSIAAIIPASGEDRRLNHFLFASLSLLLLLFAGFRYYTGYDYQNYMNIYHASKSQWHTWTIEPIPRLMMQFSHNTGIGYTGFLFITALLAIALKARFILIWSVLPLFSLLLYYSRVFLLSDFGQIRQGLALAVVLWSWIYLLRNDLPRFTLVVLLATLIHISAIFFILVYFFARRRYTVAWILVMIALVIPFAFIDLKKILIEVLAPLLPPFIGSKLMFYSVVESGFRIGLSYAVLMRIGILFICIFLQRDYFLEDRERRTILNVYLFGILFYVMFNSFPQVGNRGSFYFQQFEILLIPLMLVQFKDHINRAIFFLFIAFYCYWGVNTTLQSQPESFIPYKSAIQKEIF